MIPVWEPETYSKGFARSSGKMSRGYHVKGTPLLIKFGSCMLVAGTELASCAVKPRKVYYHTRCFKKENEGQLSGFPNTRKRDCKYKRHSTRRWV